MIRLKKKVKIKLRFQVEKVEKWNFSRERKSSSNSNRCGSANSRAIGKCHISLDGKIYHLSVDKMNIPIEPAAKKKMKVIYVISDPKLSN